VTDVVEKLETLFNGSILSFDLRIGLGSREECRFSASSKYTL
jgi:hypothetical protein